MPTIMDSRAPSNRSAQDATREPGPSSTDPPVVTTGELLRGGNELLIHHGDDVYRLLVTSNGKLLLNKHTRGTR